MTKITKVLQVYVTLTDAEQAEKVSELTSALMDKTEKETFLKSYVSDEKAKISMVDANIKMLTLVVSKKQELRNVECEVKKNFETKKIEYYSTQNNELIKTEPFSASDFQLDLHEQLAIQELDKMNNDANEPFAEAVILEGSEITEGNPKLKKKTGKIIKISEEAETETKEIKPEEGLQHSIELEKKNEVEQEKKNEDLSEAENIRKVLIECNWKRREAAIVLSISERTLGRKMKEFDINPV